ncbi:MULTISPECIES: ABC transporter ATP-binding protein [Bifidobacterium]|uniref:ABC transporter ATP-binding protein n=1 Tax=Bifidobacterium apousia TaxID=2750996 RepID=A0A556R3C0_9BIFI|nr:MULTISPECIES: ABC transporter ATP-binding protein [Bifidobacterium]MBI0061875.1 ABC transporter ATP-binding protein [Bifidobacterium apousia]MBI0072084.1 ABC transporter ATP-binding protein [Bifidobacterium sp. W8112]MBI0124710.1 ABC transporter ATP-binding protein [Bifidobacterium apousia]MBI0136755.1 ABC transporter ATP-binding protein [Bifidobacterium sp. W8120]TSJ83384.1 ABC transporter ATP-binding protein [Bifidobacterium apousia]
MKFSNKTDSLPEDVALRVSHVSKDFKLPYEKTNSLKGVVFNTIRRQNGYTIQHVLKDISFEIKKGDFFGIVGKNGSGKSTLLKIISRIYSPNSGKVQVNGKLVPFIELGVGFNPELTGRENVYLNGAMLGFTREEIDDMYDDIVDFAELGDFMEQKLKNYSSGMQVRLAFSVAIKSQGDILVLDEVLAVGDEAFQKKCQDYFFEAKREKKTIILVTHSMSDVRKFCNKAMLIQDGVISKFGMPDDVASAYSDYFLEQQQKAVQKDNEAVRLEHGNGIRMVDVQVTTNGRSTQLLDINQNFTIKIVFECDRDIPRGVFAINLIDQQGRVALATSNKVNSDKDTFTKGRHEIVFEIENVLASGDYHVNIAAASGNDLLLKQSTVYQFQVRKAKLYDQSLTHPRISVKLI